MKIFFILLSLILIINTISTKEKKSVIVYGSSTFSLMSNDISNMLKSLGFNYKNNTAGGQIIETISAQQGSNPIKISFIDPSGIKFKESNKINISQFLSFGKLKPRGEFNVKLENGVEGIINLNKKIFIPTSSFYPYQIKNNSFIVDFGN